MHAGVKLNQDDAKEVCDAFYLLWDLRASSIESDDVFKMKIKKLLPMIAELGINLKNTILSIEIVIDSITEWTANKLDSKVFDMTNWINETCPFGCTYTGICDSVGGAPALEAILDYSKMIEDHNLHSVMVSSVMKTLRVTIVNLVELLGHDPSREPDAVSGVYQAEYVFCDIRKINAKNDDKSKDNQENGGNIVVRENSENKNKKENATCCSNHTNSSISDWAKLNGMEHSMIKRDSNGQRGDNMNKMSKSTTANIFNFFLFILACFIACYYQVHYMKKQ